MKMKKLTAIALVSAMMLSVAGCGGKAESTSSDPAAAQEQDTEAAGETANEPEENQCIPTEPSASIAPSICRCSRLS